MDQNTKKMNTKKIYQRAGWKFFEKLLSEQGLISASRVENFVKIVKQGALLIDTTEYFVE